MYLNQGSECANGQELRQFGEYGATIKGVGSQRRLELSKRAWLVLRNWKGIQDRHSFTARKRLIRRDVYSATKPSLCSILITTQFEWKLRTKRTHTQYHHHNGARKKRRKRKKEKKGGGGGGSKEDHASLESEQRVDSVCAIKRIMRDGYHNSHIILLLG